MNAMSAERVWRCARCRAMNRDREIKCGECGKHRDVLDAFVGPAFLEIERAQIEARTLAHLYETTTFHPGYDPVLAHAHCSIHSKCCGGGRGDDVVSA